MKDYVTPAPYVIFEEDGTIIAAGRQGISFITDRIAAGERILIAPVPLVESEVGATRFVDVAARVVRMKTPCPARLDGMMLHDLPLPCTIEISAPLNGLITHDEAEDTELSLSFDHPGTYAIRVTSPRHLPGNFTATKEG
ncbi:hypothetical protein CLBKND_04919 [Methylorubrum aminovorans]